MSKKRNKAVQDLLGKPVPRRAALGGLGAMAVLGPIAAACSSDEGTPGTATGGAPGSTGGSGGTPGSSTGGSLPTGGSKAATGGSPSSTGGISSTGGASPQATGGTQASTGGTNTGGTDAKGGAGAGGTDAKGGAGAGGEATNGGGGAGGANGGTSGSPNGGSGGGGSSGSLVPPAWDDVPMCTASKMDGAGQGPFMIHEGEKDDDVSMIRQDIRGQYNEDAEPGIEMELHLRILSSKSSDCNGTPVADAEIYIWHTDAQGYYSGFGTEGTNNEQRPDEPYGPRFLPGMNDLDTNERFCRGIQITDANGVVSFRSYFPGWYNGRDIHIHFVALKKGSMSRGRMNYSGEQHLFTTQFYFDPALTEEVHKSAEPYKRRTTITEWAGGILADENNNSGLRAKATFASNKVVAQMQILLDPKA